MVRALFDGMWHHTCRGHVSIIPRNLACLWCQYQNFPCQMVDDSSPPYLFNDATLGEVVCICFLPPEQKLFSNSFLPTVIPELLNVEWVIESLWGGSPTPQWLKKCHPKTGLWGDWIWLYCWDNLPSSFFCDLLVNHDWLLFSMMGWGKDSISCS